MKSKFLIVVAGLWVSFANAAELSDQLAQCRAVQNDLQRLICYDKIGTSGYTPAVGAVVAEPRQLPPENSPATVTAAPDNFGIEHKVIEKAASSISSTVVSIVQSKRGFWTITLDNGQKWRQISSDGFVLRKGEEIEISRGTFNSFLLSKKGSERQTKVTRLQE
jgi:hypothetical protein